MPRMKAKSGMMDRPSRLLLFARRHRRRARPLAFVLLLCVGAGGVLHYTHLMRDERSFAPVRSELGRRVALRVTAIEITGRDLTPEAQIDRALGVKVGDDILGFSVEGARKRLDALSFVEHATVERRLPGTVVVRITERRPFAVWQNGGRFVLIDRSGQLVADQGMNGKDATAFEQLPLVVGAGAPEAAAGLIEALDSEPAVHAHVAAAVRVGRRRWNLALKNGCDVMLPEGEEKPALQRLAQLQEKDQLLVRPLEVIDMRLPDRLVIRPRPAPATEEAAPAAGEASAPAGKAAARPGDKPGEKLGARMSGQQGMARQGDAGASDESEAGNGRRPA